MSFKREHVTNNDAEIIDNLKEQFGYPKKDHKFSTWIIDRETNDFLVKIGGDGFHNKKKPGVFIYGSRVGITRIEADYTVAGRALDGCGVFWNIIKIVAPIAYKDEKDMLLNSIHLAFRCYGIGFDPAMIHAFELNYHCDPEFV
ncbi:hypothetical protein K0T92_16325 [Paenibacillus oenotherae]|uniref:Uncharacterized protein n=1 Tax=Paenibacillus oenotherae TaxID=1435645 RepID=A0ABS7D8N4_9BACL|nr:hypothetical protein [Paenibacillus oenotherae]MBW7476300.1 hypothetical protein [Paenibacillus oenotherae]